MGNEQDQSQELSVARSPEEIQKRIEELKLRIKLNDVQINVGTYANPVMVPPLRYELLVARLNELRWLTGENVGIIEGIE